MFHVFGVFLKTATFFFGMFWARGTINPAHRGPKATFFVFFLQRFSEVAPRQRTSRKYTFSDEKQVAVLEFLHFAKIHCMQRNHCVCCFVLRRNKKPKTKKQQKNINFSKTAFMFVHSWGTPFSCSSTYCDLGVPKQRLKLASLGCLFWGRGGECRHRQKHCFPKRHFFFRQHRSTFVKQQFLWQHKSTFVFF